MEYHASQNAANECLAQYPKLPPPSTQACGPPSGYDYHRPCPYLSEYYRALGQRRDSGRLLLACTVEGVSLQIRCSGPESGSSCQNCVRMNRHCVFQPVSSSDPMKYPLYPAFSGGVKNEALIYGTYEQSVSQLKGRFPVGCHTSIREDGGYIASQGRGQLPRPNTRSASLSQNLTYRPTNSITGSNSPLISTQEARTAQNGSSASSASQGPNVSDASADRLSIAFMID